MSGQTALLAYIQTLTKFSAAITLTSAKFQASADGDFGKEAHSLLTENETTISVNWTGGGQHLKEGELENDFGGPPEPKAD